MSVRQFGLSVMLSFKDNGATKKMEKLGKTTDLLKQRFKGVKDGVKQFGTGIKDLTMAMAPLSVGFGLAAKDGMKFEDSMANLRAVTLDTTGEMTKDLEGLAKSMGATTKFSASEAADAMTNLSRAGLTVNEVMGAIPGTLSAAAAEGIDIATAANLVASNMKAFGLEADQASKVAGTLALTSARTNTNMVDLQEGMKLAAPAAKTLGVSLADTAGILGGLANIGIKGTMSGTALKNAFKQLSSPTNKVKKGIKSLNLDLGKLRDQMGGGKSVKAFTTIIKALSKVKNNADKAAIASNIFGERGKAIASAIPIGGKAAEKFTETIEALRKETGKTAEDMKNIQLQSLTGQLKILRSTTEAVNIELFGLASKELRGGVVDFSKSIGDLSLALRFVRGEEITDPKTLADMNKLSSNTLQIAQGIKEGFGEIKATIKGAINSIRSVGQMFGFFTDTSTRGTAKMITKIIGLSAVMAPLGVAVLGVSKIFMGFTNVAVGSAKTIINSFGIARKVTGGIFRKVPVLGKLLGKAGGLAGKASGIGDISKAQPVKVVNFNEMTGATSGLLGPNSPLGKETAGQVGLFTRMRGGVNKFGDKIGLAGRSLAARGGLILAAAGAGAALGTLIDQTFDLSGKLSSLFAPKKDEAKLRRQADELAFRNAKIMANQLATLAQSGKGKITTAGGKEIELTKGAAINRVRQFLLKQGVDAAAIQKSIINMESTFASISRSREFAFGGKSIKTKESGESFKRRARFGQATTNKVTPARDAIATSPGFLPVSAGDVVLDAKSLANAIISQKRGGLVNRATENVSQQQPQTVNKNIKIEIPVQIDGRQIAIAVAEVQLDDLERRGEQLNPGDQSTLLERGFM